MFNSSRPSKKIPVFRAGFYTKLNVWGSLGLNFEYDGGPIIEIGGPIFLYKFRFWKVVHPSVKAQCCPQVRNLEGHVWPPSNIFVGSFEIFEGHILPSVKHNPILFFYKS